MPSYLDDLTKIASSAATGAAAGGPAGAVIASVAPVYGLINSFRQRQLAKDIENSNVDPGFNSNPYIDKNLNLALAEFNQRGLPGEATIRNQFDQSQAAGINAAKTLTNSTDFSNTIAGITEGRIGQDAQLGIAGANKDAQDLQVLMGANNAAGEDFLRGEDYKMQKYLRAAAAASAYRGAANIGTENALKDVSTIAGLANGSNNLDLETLKLLLRK